MDKWFNHLLNLCLLLKCRVELHEPLGVIPKVGFDHIYGFLPSLAAFCGRGVQTAVKGTPAALRVLEPKSLLFTLLSEQLSVTKSWQRYGEVLSPLCLRL